MPITHTNRGGDVYYLHQRATKSGKPSYYFSRKKTGNIAEAGPEGYEVYEEPTKGQVFLRKARPALITPEELACVE
jgi:hypothetical protein